MCTLSILRVFVGDFMKNVRTKLSLRDFEIGAVVGWENWN